MSLSWGTVFQTENSRGPEVGCSGVLERHICGSQVSKRKSVRDTMGEAVWPEDVWSYSPLSRLWLSFRMRCKASRRC